MSKNKGRNLPYSISQNFLTSKKRIELLLDKTNISSDDIVLEIGAGKGHITKSLSSRCKNIIAYEIDRELYACLKPQLNANVNLICADFLGVHLPKTPYKVFSNIPFSKTAAIIRKLTTSSTLPTDIWLVVERGAAKRFSGLPKDNFNSLLLKPFFEAKTVYRFSRNDFHPAPRVDAVLFELKQRPIPDILPKQRKAFSAFLTHSMKHGLFGPRALLTKKQIAAALRLAKLPHIEPSGDILYIQWLCLFRCWARFQK